MERKKGRSGSNQTLIQSKLRCTVLQTDVIWMRAVTVWIRSFFCKENGSYRIYCEIVSLYHYRETIKRVGQDKSGLLFQEVQVSFQLFNDTFRIKSTFNWSNTVHFFKKSKRLKIKKLAENFVPL